MMVRDRVTQLRIRGMRTLADVVLDLDGLTVLIGDNGTGKSTILEACEILHRAAYEGFGDDVQRIHGGAPSLLRVGVTEMVLGVRIEGNGDPLDYEIGFDPRAGIARERLCTLPQEGASAVFERVGETVRFGAAIPRNPSAGGADSLFAPDKLVLTSFGIRPPHPSMLRLRKALERIEVHAPFEVMPMWLSRSTQRRSAMRGVSLHQPTDRLERLGANLANAYSALKNDFDEDHWQQTMAYVRLGLGEDIRTVNLRPDAGGAEIGLWIKYAGVDQQLPASALSDGTLAYLALVALYRLDTGSSLVAMDEPELHLHPALLMRALDFFEAMARDRPVLLATHSDRLLDGLSDPARSAVLCELDEERRTRLRRPDPEALQRWLTRYRGLGDIRGAGHQASIMAPELPS